MYRLYQLNATAPERNFNDIETYFNFYVIFERVYFSFNFPSKIETFFSVYNNRKLTYNFLVFQK